MEKPWVSQARTITELLELEGSPVAVTFTNDVSGTGDGRHTWICRAMKKAAEGESFVIDGETSACPGGSWHCGLSQPPDDTAKRALQAFLTGGEKLTHSIVSFQRMTGLTSPPPTGLSERILIGPMESAAAPPDLALFLCNPEQACRLLSLDHYWDGIPPRIEVAGSLCHSAIAYPVATGHTNLTLGDWTARRMQKYSPETVFLSIPYERMHNLVLAIPECSAGTAPVEMPEGFSRLMDETV